MPKAFSRLNDYLLQKYINAQFDCYKFGVTQKGSYKTTFFWDHNKDQFYLFFNMINSKKDADS